MTPRILIAGGYGVVGSTIARQIRSIWADDQLILAGRKPEQGAVLACEIGATTARLDVEDVGSLPELGSVDLVVSALYDPGNSLVEAAIRAGVAHISITTKADDLAPVALAALKKLPKRPVVVLGYSAAGAALHVALQAARHFTSIDSIGITAVFDERDPVGPMTASDAEMLIGHAVMRTSGAWQWVDGRHHGRSAPLAEGNIVETYPTGLLDAAGLAAVTGAANIRCDIAQGKSLGRLAGGAASSDAYIDIAGRTEDGQRRKTRTVLSDPRGLAHLTGLGVLVAIERALGLDGGPPAGGGLYGAETLISAAAAVSRFEQFGVRVSSNAT